MRSFEHKLTKSKEQCLKCGLIKGNCICDMITSTRSSVEFWLLTHEEELKRTSNTGRLIEYYLENTRVFKWHRKEQPKELLELIRSNQYNIYIVFSAEREAEKQRVESYKEDHRKTVFLIIDGTWKEARKILRKSPYLDQLSILPLSNLEKSIYDMRRNNNPEHICTAEVAINLLDMVGEQSQSQMLKTYFNVFIEKYHQGQYNHEVNKND